MSKGIATIIATIIMVVITIGLISTAYIYFSSIVTVGPVVSAMVVPRCKWDGTGGYYNITVFLKNEGTDTWNSIDWLFDGDTLPSGCIIDTACNSVAAGKTASCVIQNNTAGGCNLECSGTHMITAIGPRNQVAIPVTC